MTVIRDWDDAHDNMGHVPGSETLPDRWAAAASDYRTANVVETDIAYGETSRQVMDIVWPNGDPVGLAVFVHGGYWRRFSKDSWTHFAEGARRLGWAVCIPSYTLAPAARISQMVAEVGMAIEAVAEQVRGPIRLAGHSAGGHLVTRMVCLNGPLCETVAQRIEHVLSISGLHDLRPLMRTKMNETLNIDEQEACTESPALLRPVPHARIIAWVGGGERPEFIRQSELLANIWTGLGADTSCRIDGTHDHFSVIEGLKDRTSEITAAFVGA